jgi:hypothetical protein
MKLNKEIIISFATEHSPLGGKRTTFETDNLLISIVGGRPGLYGDFDETFELAIMDNKTRSFVTKDYVPDVNDDVVGYMSIDDLLEVVNPLIENGFRVI